MRPVNLIPPEERRGERSAMRSGPLAYIVVGTMLLALAGITALVLTDNQISDSKAEVARLKQEDAAAKARAARLAAYTSFHGVREQRVATITGLADSRFDWERVMRELSLILPDNVWLTNLTGTAAAGIQLEGGANISLRASVPGPALEMVGCASGQDAVAGFVSALKDIDGVTRVGVQSSKLSSSTAGASGASPGIPGASGSSSTSDCQTRNFIAQFEIVAAFDAAPAAAAATSTTAPAPTTPTDATTTDPAAATPTSTPAPAAPVGG